MIVSTSARSRCLQRDRDALKEMAAFAAIGAVNTYVDLAVFNILVGTLHAVPANVGGYAAGMIVGWRLNRRYTFGSRSHRRLGLAIYVAVNGLGMALTSIAVYAAMLLAPSDRLSLNLTKVAAGLGVMVLKFGLLRRWLAAGVP